MARRQDAKDTFSLRFPRLHSFPLRAFAEAGSEENSKMHFTAVTQRQDAKDVEVLFTFSAPSPFPLHAFAEAAPHGQGVKFILILIS